MVQEKSVQIHVTDTGIVLEGYLALPAKAAGIVLFAHGSGSSRNSPRNRFVARFLQDMGFATLLFDLLTNQEEKIDQKTRALRFDIDLLAERLAGAARWLYEASEIKDVEQLKLGYFGASTGAAAALTAAGNYPGRVDAIVSRGGRPDLSRTDLMYVHVPTLMIVGERDEPVISMNKKAMEHLGGEKQLKIVPGASHLFEEAGTLEQVAHLAAGWFGQYLT